MPKTYIVTGTVTDGHTVTLDEELPLILRKVRLVVEPLTARSTRRYEEVAAEIRQRQRARGHEALTRAEVDALIRTERDSWGQ